MKLVVIRAAMMITVLGSCALLQSGCAVGYITFHSDTAEEKPSIAQLPEIKIAYSYANPDRNRIRENTFSLAFERSMRSRFGILDLQKIATTGTQNSERFVIDVEQRSEGPSINYVLAAINVVSLSIIPGVVTDYEDIVFTMRSPQGEEERYRYRYTERVYSWLPFMFFAPGFMAGPQIGHDYYQEDRLKIIEDITTQLMIDAAPFIREHQKQHMNAWSKTS